MNLIVSFKLEIKRGRICGLRLYVQGNDPCKKYGEN